MAYPLMCLTQHPSGNRPNEGCRQSAVDQETALRSIASTRSTNLLTVRSSG
jgi:hypothetical protein